MNSHPLLNQKEIQKLLENDPKTQESTPVTKQDYILPSIYIALVSLCLGALTLGRIIRKNLWILLLFLGGFAYCIYLIFKALRNILVSKKLRAITPEIEKDLAQGRMVSQWDVSPEASIPKELSV